MYRSAKLEELWTDGFSTVSDVTFESAAYVARYCMKKLDDGLILDKRFELDGRMYDVVARTGELRLPEFLVMSRGSKRLGTGGIGRAWYEKYKLDIYPQDYAIFRGMKCRPPKFYDGLYEIDDREGMDEIKSRRVRNSRRYVTDVIHGREVVVSDNDSVRLAVKEQVKLAQVKLLSRSGGE